MINGILGKKIGMTQIFNENGEVVPVTVITAGPCPVIQIKNKEKDGYNAVQISYGECKEKNVDKPTAGHFKKANIKPQRFIKEFKLEKTEGIALGQEIKVDIFTKGEVVDVVGTTKGKGFQGVVKRHNFRGGPRTHGQSDRQRHPGAIGSQGFQRVIKGLKMAGHMGDETRTIQHLQVINILPDKNLILVKGAIPGVNEGFVIVKKTSRKIKPKVKVALEKAIAGKGKAPREAAERKVEKKKK